MDKIYHTHIGLSGSIEELKEIFNKYDISQFNEFYFSILDPELKDAFRDYFKQRMFEHLALD